jgi:hypothetical protein
MPLQSPQPASQNRNVQTPVMQLGIVACGGLHGLPQMPQLARVVTGVSQPFALLPSQSPKGMLQAAYVQLPLPHDAPTALTGLHRVPQAPQSTSVRSMVSQPSAVLPLQLPQPGKQSANEQLPVRQVAPVTLAGLQRMPQEPQLAREVSEVSQPSAWTPSQSPQPATQPVKVQLPEAQLAPVACGGLHAIAQARQLTTVFSGASQPSEWSRLQLAQPALQMRTVQVPDPQDSVAFASSQIEPQEPQLASVTSDVSQPSARTPLQSP